jgi:hypothetical protein
MPFAEQIARQHLVHLLAGRYVHGEFQMTPEELIIKALENAVVSKETDIINDLIKIGLPILGTVIGGLLGYRATKHQADKNFEAQMETASLARSTELDLQVLEAKIQYFLQSQELIDQFTNIVADYCANVKNWRDHNKANNAELQVEKKDKHLNLEASFYDGFLLLGSAESKILMLGKPELHDIYMKFNSKAKYIYKTVHIENNTLDNDLIDSLIEEFRELKMNLLKKLGEEFEYEHNKLLKRT